MMLVLRCDFSFSPPRKAPNERSSVTAKLRNSFPCNSLPMMLYVLQQSTVGMIGAMPSTEITKVEVRLCGKEPRETSTDPKLFRNESSTNIINYLLTSTRRKNALTDRCWYEFTPAKQRAKISWVPLWIHDYFSFVLVFKNFAGVSTPVLKGGVVAVAVALSAIQWYEWYEWLHAHVV
jgi:hypothetical protein